MRRQRLLLIVALLSLIACSDEGDQVGAEQALSVPFYSLSDSTLVDCGLSPNKMVLPKPPFKEL